MVVIGEIIMQRNEVDFNPVVSPSVLDNVKIIIDGLRDAVNKIDPSFVNTNSVAFDLATTKLGSKHFQSACVLIKNSMTVLSNHSPNGIKTEINIKFDMIIIKATYMEKENQFIDNHYSPAIAKVSLSNIQQIASDFLKQGLFRFRASPENGNLVIINCKDENDFDKTVNNLTILESVLCTFENGFSIHVERGDQHKNRFQIIADRGKVEEAKILLGFPVGEKEKYSQAGLVGLNCKVVFGRKVGVRSKSLTGGEEKEELGVRVGFMSG